MSADWLVQEHNEADKDTNATYRIGVAEGLRRAKLIPKPGIGAEIAHQVAMTAAEAAARVQSFPSDSIGKDVAAAYLQAYEAVEGWTKPQTMEEFNARHGTSYVAARAHMEELQREALRRQVAGSPVKGTHDGR